MATSFRTALYLQAFKITLIAIHLSLLLSKTVADSQVSTSSPPLPPQVVAQQGASSLVTGQNHRTITTTNDEPTKLPNINIYANKNEIKNLLERNATSSRQYEDLIASSAISPLREPTSSSGNAKHHPNIQQEQQQETNANYGVANHHLLAAASDLQAGTTSSSGNNLVEITSNKVINKLDYIVEFMKANKLTKFCDLLTSEEPEIRRLNDKLNSLNQFTLFVPTNEALLLMPNGQLEQIRSNSQDIKQFLLAHATSELVKPTTSNNNNNNNLNDPKSNRLMIGSDIGLTNKIFSLSGSPMYISIGNGRRFEMIVNGANVINGQSYALQEQNNNSATYAIVHLIDRALYPTPGSKMKDLLRVLAPKMARYMDLASDRELDDEFGSINQLSTMFAPNDEAFKWLPQKVKDQLDTNRTFLVNFLRGHVVEGLRYGVQLTSPSREEEEEDGGRSVDHLMRNSTVKRLRSFSGTELQFELKRLQSRNLILVNSIPIIEQDLMALNGLVHLIARPIFEGQLSETCRCGLQTQQQQQATRNLTAYEKLWPTATPNRPSVRFEPTTNLKPVESPAEVLTSSSSIDWSNQRQNPAARQQEAKKLEETPISGNELEREDQLSVAATNQNQSQRIRSQRSGLVARNNRDFYRPSAAPANLLLVNADSRRFQEATPIVPPAMIRTDLNRGRLLLPTDRPEAGESAEKLKSALNLPSNPTSGRGDLFEVERYKVVLNADTRQRMRQEQQQKQRQQQEVINPNLQFAYDRLMVATPATLSSTTRPYSPINNSNDSTVIIPSSSNVSSNWSTVGAGTSNQEQLAPLTTSGSSLRQQRLLKFQAEDARDQLQNLRNHNMTRQASSSSSGNNQQVVYSMLPSPAVTNDYQASASSGRLQQMMGKTVAPGGGFGGCAFYDAECKRLLGRLVRLPTAAKSHQYKTIMQLQVNNSTASPFSNNQVSSSTEQHLDSTFGETTETSLGGGWTQSMAIKPPNPNRKLQQQQQQQQQPQKAFHRLSPARVSPLNQPLPPWSDEERNHLPIAPNWRAPDKDIARITGPYLGPDKKHEQFNGGVGFTSGISRGSGELSNLKQPAEQIYLTPVSVIQADLAMPLNHSSGLAAKRPDPHEMLRDTNKAIFVSPSPIMRLSQAPNQQVRANLASTISHFHHNQYHTPTPYSVSLITTHLPPIFQQQPNTQAVASQQYSRLTNFSTSIDHALDDTPPNLTAAINNNNKQHLPMMHFESQSIPKAPSAHRKQRLHQLQGDNNGTFGSGNFDMNPASGEKQARRIVRLQAAAEQPATRQTMLGASGEDIPGGDISVTSARLNSSPMFSFGNYTLGTLATQASNQAPNVSSSNLVRSALLSNNPSSDYTTDFFQDRTIAEIMDDSGLRIDGQQVTFSRLKECLTEADLLSLVAQTGSSVTIFMPTDSAFQRLVQQQAIAQQRSSSSSSSGSRSGRLLDPNRRYLLPLVVRRSGKSLDSRRQVSSSADLILPSAAASTSAEFGNDLTSTADKLTLDCSSSQVRQLLLDHLSARLITPKQLQHDLGISGLSGHQLLLSSVPSKKIVVVDGQPVIAATRAKNGMVYVVNKFLNLTQQVPNVVDLMETQTNLTTFLSYLRFSSLSDRLKREMGPLTVLAPTNEAFDQLSSSARQLINSDPAALMDILRGHIVEGAQFGKLISMRNQLKTMNPDQKIEAKVIKPNVYLLDNQMTSMRLVGTTGNGVVNTIDRLIVPSWLKVTALGSTSKPPTNNNNNFISTEPRVVASERERNSFTGELEGNTVTSSSSSSSPSIPLIVTGSSAALNLPVIRGDSPVRFEQPSAVNRLNSFVGSNTFLFGSNSDSANQLNNQTSTFGTAFITEPTSSTSATNFVDNNNNNNNNLFNNNNNNVNINNNSPFLKVANNLSSITAAGAPKRTLNTGGENQNQMQQQPIMLNNATTSTKNMQLIEKLANLMQARKFVKYLIRSRVSELLKPDMNYVILVPTDQAIEKLPKQIIDMLERDLERLADLMNYHVLDTTFEYINAIPDGQTLNTLNEKDIVFNWHRNNTILTASGAVVMGGIQEDNIALLIVDRVLYPTPGDILNIISKSPILSKFTNLIKQAGLEKQLSLPGPYTLFAPSDFAFNQLDKRDLDTLQRNKETARRFLLRHLSQPTVFTSSIALANGTQLQVTNSLGEDLMLRQRNDYFSVNDVNFSYADVAATNGVVHVIDGLL